jgi:protein TonB
MDGATITTNAQATDAPAEEPAGRCETTGTPSRIQQAHAWLTAAWRGGRRPSFSLTTVLGLHVVLLGLLLHYRPVAIPRLQAAQPMMVAMITPPAPKPVVAPPSPLEPPPKVEPQRPLPKPQPKKVVEKKKPAPKPRAIRIEEQPEQTPPPVAAAPRAPVGPPKEDADPAPVPPRFNADYLNNPAPQYPPISRRSGEQGRVFLSVLVSPQGLPEVVQIKRGCGHERLDSAALDAVKKWKFVPAKLGNQTVRAWVIVPIYFSLRG